MQKIIASHAVFVLGFENQRRRGGGGGGGGGGGVAKMHNLYLA